MRGRSNLFFIAAVIVFVLGVRNLHAECLFRNSRKLHFGKLDPGNPVDVSSSGTITVRCNPSVVFTITDDDGANESGPDSHRMRNIVNSNQFLPYRFTYPPSPDAAALKSAITFTGTVKGMDYQNAYRGRYFDTVVLTINP